MSFLVASQIVLWIAVLGLGVLCLALARQIGVLHERIAPAGALALKRALKVGDPAPQFALTGLDGGEVRIGGAPAGRSQLLLFVSPDCPICASLLPAIRSAQGAERKWLDVVLASDGDAERHRAFVRDKGLGKFPYVLSEALGRTFGVAKLPFAVLIDEAGKLAAAGLVNTREHLESLFIAKERQVASLQEYLEGRSRITASTGDGRG
ncbi:MAG TPA: methylamine dehydrogenase accessory protein MauD [Steroidobacteraceae bacterium]|nr:methylamine dehydrogenase accessory protein MauD [Steroidobacteraceae bacterium]